MSFSSGSATGVAVVCLISVAVVLAAAGVHQHTPLRAKATRQRTTYQNQPILNGALIMQNGFDARTGLNGTSLANVFAFTYEMGQTWTSPSSNITYLVPDQLSISPMTWGTTLVDDLTTATYSEVEKYYTSWFKFSVGGSYDGFKASVNYDHTLATANEQLNAGLNEAGVSRSANQFYTLAYPPAYVMTGYLDHNFELSVMGLPPTISSASDSQFYAEFVQAYGTHFICNAGLGGLLHQMSFLNKEVAAQYSYQQVTQQFGFQFSYDLFTLAPSGFTNQTQIAMSSWFSNNVKVYNMFRGGNPDYMSNNTLNQWLDSTADTPGLLNATLCELSELLVRFPTTQTTLQSYLQTYVNS